MASTYPTETIAAALAERWAEDLQAGETFSVEIEDSGPHVRVLFALVAGDGSSRHEFEVVAPRSIGGGKAGLDLALDAADALLGEWFEDGRPRLPATTVEREYERTPVRVTTRLVLPHLEEEADRILGERPGKKDFDA